MIHQTSFDRPILILRGESYTYEFLRLYTGPYIGTYVGRTFVTQDMWQEIMGGNPSRYVGSNFPVDSVSYNDIKLFIDTLKETSGINNLTLLDERIWRSCAAVSIYQSYFAIGADNNDHIINRAGNKAGLFKDRRESIGGLYIPCSLDYREGKIPYFIWSSENSDMHPHEVNSSQPNAIGLYDMRGNVWNICQKVEKRQSVLNRNVYEQNRMCKKIDKAILKGGAWNVAKDSCMSDYSIELGNDERYVNASFRIVCKLDE